MNFFEHNVAGEPMPIMARIFYVCLVLMPGAVIALVSMRCAQEQAAWPIGQCVVLKINGERGSVARAEPGHISVRLASNLKIHDFSSVELDKCQAAAVKQN